MKKSIFLFFAAILCAMSVSAKVIYFKPNGNWAEANANFYAYVWGGEGATPPVEFTPVATDPDVYEAEVGTHTSIIFLRHNPATTVTSDNMWSCWNRMGNLSIPTDGKNCCAINGNEWTQNIETTNGAASYVTWSTYTPPTEPVIPDYYVAGNSAFVGANSWDDGNPAHDALKMVYSETNANWTLTVSNVAADADCQFKVNDGTWSKSWGYDKLSTIPEGVSNNTDGNICFTLSTAGDVTITFDGTNIQLTTTGAFKTFNTYDITVKAVVPEVWTSETISIHYWGDGVESPANPAPTVKEGNWNVYTITGIPEGKSVSVIFLNGTAWTSDKTQQTVNLTDITGNTCFQISAIDKATDDENKCTADVVDCEADITPEPAVPVVTYDYYIAGSLPGTAWQPNSYGLDLVEGKTDVYTATFALEANTDYAFKITDGNWNSDGDNTHEHTALATTYVGVSHDNDGNIAFKLSEAKELVVTFNSTEDKIYLNLDEETASLTYTVKVPEGTEACFIAGPCGDWSFREMTREGETDIFKIEITGAKETDEYKYACQADWAYAEVIEGGGNRTTWSALDEVTAWNKPVVYTYYLMGVNGDWTTGIEMEVNTGAENEVMLTCQPVNGEVKIKRLGDDESEYWYGGKSLKEEAGNLGTNTEAATGGDGNILLEEGIYNFYFNTADGKLWIAVATDCETEPTTVTLTYDLTTDAVSNKMGRRYVTAEDATLGNVQIILPSFNTETTEYTDASLVVGDETLGATATYTADTDNNKETYTATATSEDGTTTYNVTMTIIVPATQTYTFIATIGAEATVNEYEWGTEYSINGSGYLDDTPVEFELLADNMGFLSGTINGVDVYCSDATTNTENELGETYLSVMATAQDAVGNTYNIQMWVLIVVEKVEIVITEEIDVTLGNLKLEPMGNMAMVTADNLSFWMTLLETENYYGTYESDMFSNIWYGGDDDAIQLQAYGEGIYTSNALTVSFISEPDAEGNATKYNFTLTRKTITLTTGDNSTVIAANIGETVNVKIERSFTANDGYYTLCVPFNMPASVIGKAYSLGTITEHVSGEGININLEEESELSAGVPYLVLPKANMSELVVENVTIQSDIASGQNIYSEELNVNIFFEGFYSASGQTNGTTQYYVGNNGYLYNEVVDKRGLSGLFTITDKNGAPLKVRARVVTREEVETGLDNNQLPNTNIQKVLENGQLIIIRDGVKYNVQGQKL